MAASSSNQDEMISGINVTPLVDVVLVLLVILMVTATTLVSRTISVDLPKAATGQATHTLLAITLDRSGEGTYEVAADCSGVTQFQPDPENPGIVIEEKFVIVNRGDELRSITTSPPPLMVTSTGKRVRGH